MRDTELIAKWFEDLAAGIRRRITPLDAEALGWRADERGNNVRETVWHMARWIDVLERVFSAKSTAEERWIADGWAQRSGYDPRGIGDDGLGVLTGYSFEEVLRIPHLTGDELVRYFDSVVTPLAARLRALGSDEEAEKIVRRSGGILRGCLAHLGEIDALMAIRDRSLQRASV